MSFAAVAAPIGAPGAAPPVVDYSQMRMAKLQALAARYEIRPDFVSRMRELEKYEIVLLCDDSGSMSTPVGGAVSGFGARKTRWDELREYCTLAVEISSCFDADGIDLYFLNRCGGAPFTHISSAEQVAAAFAAPPSGGTPLVAALNRIFSDKRAVIAEKPLLLLLATDGEPSEGTGAFTSAVRNRPRNTFVSILACTDDEAAVGYLDALDHGVPGVDVNDDYQSERRQIQRVQGPKFAYSFADHVTKTMLGPVDRWFDSLDEGGAAGCCAIA